MTYDTTNVYKNLKKLRSSHRLTADITHYVLFERFFQAYLFIYFIPKIIERYLYIKVPFIQNRMWSIFYLIKARKAAVRT